ncbi:Ppx/GppA phosphatase family protein [Methylomagnum ishizawai]|uniref:Ppx/GppA phosphatase family protein n=1 Tax=Methylomagnum ishizawai TaxID=1760988 RepID=UPI001C33E28A|nr:Ppx/GppA phosphatase family protein [Methylomagnum ishizawai]BBL76135.1 exopolyphosphatase [Methylomagnum ishizawai]
MNFAPENLPSQVAAVDLGSNSFHMIVAEVRANELVMVDRLREMVRLGAGLTPQRSLTPEVQQRALACVERFGQRLRAMPPGCVRAVGTNTLREARNAGAFLVAAERALGHPIEIISGIEEARLIYQGVAQSLAPDGKRRLVMDIGGGSTEYIIGIDKTPLQKESLRMGCVSMSLEHFPDGKVTAKRFKKAVIAAQRELEPFEHLFRKGAWDEAVGASGTLRAVHKLLVGRAWSKGGIGTGELHTLVDAMLAAGKVDKAQFADVDPDRYLSLPGGLAILYATFKSLDIAHMRVSDGALREGLLYDLLGRIHHDDIRGRTVMALAKRYHIDLDHAGRVQKTLGRFLEQLPFAGPIDRETAAQWLDWAATLYEIGLDIAHSGYHKHGAYVLENADLPGFSRQDQLLLATLVRLHRRKFQPKLIKDLNPPWNEAAQPLALLLRLAIVLHRSRHAAELPDIRIALGGARIDLRFPPGWLDEHPLTVADLEQEAAYLGAAEIELTFL